MYGRFFGLPALGNTNDGQTRANEHGTLLEPSASVYRYLRALVRWLTHGRNITFALVRFSVHDAISYPTCSDFRQYGGINLVKFETRYNFGCAESDVTGQPGSSALQKEMRTLGIAATAQRTNTLENESSYLNGTAILVFSPKHLRMHFYDQFEIQL